MKTSVNFYKLAKFADPGKEYTKHPYFTGSEIVHTNGHFMMIAKATSDADVPGNIPMESMKPVKNDKTGGYVHLGEKEAMNADCVKFPRPEHDAKYLENLESIRKPFVPEARVTFNVEYLAALVAAASGRSKLVTIEMKDCLDTLHPIRVKFWNNNDAEAILMPCRNKVSQ